MFVIWVSKKVKIKWSRNSNLLLLNLLSSFLSFFSAQFWTLLLHPDLQNSRHPAREQHNLQVEANASHDFGPDISVWTPSLTQTYLSNSYILYHFDQFGRPRDPWQTCWIFGFGRLPKHPWQSDFFSAGTGDSEPEGWGKRKKRATNRYASFWRHYDQDDWKDDTK